MLGLHSLCIMYLFLCCVHHAMVTTSLTYIHCVSYLQVICTTYSLCVVSSGRVCAPRIHCVSYLQVACTTYSLCVVSSGRMHHIFIVCRIFRSHAPHIHYVSYLQVTCTTYSLCVVSSGRMHHIFIMCRIFRSHAPHIHCVSYLQVTCTIYSLCVVSSGHMHHIFIVCRIFRSHAPYIHCVSYLQVACTTYSLCFLSSGRVHHAMGHYMQAVQYLQQGLQMAEQLGRKEDEARIRHRLGLALWGHSDLEEAQYQLYKAAELFENIRREAQISSDYKLSLFDLQTASYQALQVTMIR